MHCQSTRRQRYPLDLLTHATTPISVAHERALETMPRVNKRSRRMKDTIPGTAPLASGALHAPPQSAVFERKHTQPDTAKIGRKQMPSSSIEPQRMGMRRGLQLCGGPASGLLKNAADLPQAPVVCNRTQVVDSAAIGRHCKQLSIRRDRHMP